MHWALGTFLETVRTPRLIEWLSLYHVPLQGPMRTLWWWSTEWLDGGGSGQDLPVFKTFFTLKIIFLILVKDNSLTPSFSSPGLSNQTCWLRDLWWADPGGPNHTFYWSPNELPFSIKDTAQKSYFWGSFPDSPFTPRLEGVGTIK